MIRTCIWSNSWANKYQLKICIFKKSNLAISWISGRTEALIYIPQMTDLHTLFTVATGYRRKFLERRQQSFNFWQLTPFSFCSSHLLRYRAQSLLASTLLPYISFFAWVEKSVSVFLILCRISKLSLNKRSTVHIMAALTNILKFN